MCNISNIISHYNARNKYLFIHFFFALSILDLSGLRSPVQLGLFVGVTFFSALKDVSNEQRSHCAILTLIYIFPSYRNVSCIFLLT
jgi:hypothetical protein